MPIYSTLQLTAPFRHHNYQGHNILTLLIFWQYGLVPIHTCLNDSPSNSIVARGIHGVHGAYDIFGNYDIHQNHGALGFHGIHEGYQV